MKANLKGLGGIKGLILLHGEKVLIVAVGICTLLFIYYSMQLERLDDKYQAEQLKNEISTTEALVRDFSWEKAIAQNPEEVRMAKKLDRNPTPEVDPQNYRWSGVDPVVIKPTVLRDDPPLLAAAELEGTGVSGLFPFLDEKVMKERALKRAAEEAQNAKEEQERMEREQQQADQRGGERGGRDRRGGRGEEIRGYEYDPEHPNRRPLEAMTQAPGAQIMGDERIERSFFAVIVAKVPIKEQLKLFRDAFENTRGGYNPQYDFPRYLGYFVQRAEVLPGKELQWVNVDVEDGQGNKMGAPGRAPVNNTTMTKLFDVIQKDWATQVPEPVDPRWLDPSGLLAFPLPPLLGRDWGQEATHPDIPLAIDAPQPEMETDPTLAQQEPTPTTDEQGFSQNLDSTIGGMGGYGRGDGGRGRPGMGYGGMRGGYGGEGLRGPGGRGGYPSMMRGMMRGGGYGYGSGERGGGGYFRGGANADMLPRGVDSYLLRFIDFSAEPGRKYKYRVRLVLVDPNNYYKSNPELQPNTLASSVRNRLRESAKKSSTNEPPYYRLADWSEPSPTIGIPLAGSVRLASAKARNTKLFNDEPSATLLVESFDLDAEGNAIQAANEKELKRGYVANMVEDTEYIVSDGRSIDKKDDFRFMTGVTVVDVAGGEKLTRDMESPGRVLLLDPSGELYVRRELDDAPAVNLHKMLFTKPKRNRDDEMPFRGREGGYRGGGRGGYGGY